MTTMTAATQQQVQKTPTNNIIINVDGTTIVYYILSQEELNYWINKANAVAMAGAAIQAKSNEEEPEEEEYITRDRAAQLLHIDKTTLWRWSKDGLLKIHKLGNSRRILYKMAEIREFLDGKE